MFPEAFKGSDGASGVLRDLSGFSEVQKNSEGNHEGFQTRWRTSQRFQGERGVVDIFRSVSGDKTSS